MQLMKHLSKHLLLLTAALTAYCAGRAAAEDFDSVTASTNCTATTVTVSARSDIECAVKSAQVNSSLSYSFINEVCVLSDSPDCAASDAATVFRKQRLEGVSDPPHPGYEQQIGARRFWVFQQRQTGQVTFNRTWMEYETGFGDTNETEFWSGLQLIHAFTQSRSGPTLRIEMTTVNGTGYVGEWPTFTVADATINYTMKCGVMVAGSHNISCDPMSVHNGSQFSTMDRDNDKITAGSWSIESGRGGFWFSSLLYINPNGIYSMYPMYSSGQLGSSSYISCQCVENFMTLGAIRMMLQM